MEHNRDTLRFRWLTINLERAVSALAKEHDRSRKNVKAICHDRIGVAWVYYLESHAPLHVS